MTTTSRKHASRKAKATTGRNGTRQYGSRPRLSVFRSLRNISCQLIDDTRGHTVAAASSVEKEVRTAIQGLRKTDVAKKVGALLAERAKKAGVTKVAFD